MAKNDEQQSPAAAAIEADSKAVSEGKATAVPGPGQWAGAEPVKAPNKDGVVDEDKEAEALAIQAARIPTGQAGSEPGSKVK